MGLRDEQHARRQVQQRLVGQRHVGPVVADTDQAAIDLVAALAVGAPGIVRVDAAAEQDALRAWCRGNGLDERRNSPRFVPGPDLLADLGASGPVVPVPDPRYRTLTSQGFG